MVRLSAPGAASAAFSDQLGRACRPSELGQHNASKKNNQTGTATHTEIDTDTHKCKTHNTHTQIQAKLLENGNGIFEALFLAAASGVSLSKLVPTNAVLELAKGRCQTQVPCLFSEVDSNGIPSVLEENSKDENGV